MTTPLRQDLRRRRPRIALSPSPSYPDSTPPSPRSWGIRTHLMAPLLPALVVLYLAVSTTSTSLRTRSVQDGVPDGAPPGFEQYISPIIVPSPNISGSGGWAPALKKARHFVDQLTLPELVNLTTGAGILNRCVGNTGTVERLGFEGICLEDSPLGVRFADFVSAFSAGINAAATWDKNLIRRRGVAMGKEFRGKGVNVALGPMMNMGRAPAAGRNWEGFGADPYLTGVASVETIEGTQSQGVIACAKHWIGNEQEHFRGGSGSQTSSSNINDRTMHEIYMWPFAESVRAGVGSVMCSYNRLNQTHACENSMINNGLLKEELDFQGFVVSDWAAIVSGVSTALGGTDMNMPGFYAYTNLEDSQSNPAVSNTSYWGAALVEAVNNGSVPLTRVQDMVMRTMAAYYKLGQDKDFPAVNFHQLTQDTYLNGELVNEHVNVQRDHRKLIREMGAASTVLLKNERKTLPLDAASFARWGFFGSDAGPGENGPNGCLDRACSEGTLAMGWGSGTANFPYLVDPYSALQTFIHSVKNNAVIEAVLNDYSPQVATIASLADICLVFANSNSGEGFATVDENAGDRNNLTLWHSGDDLIANVSSRCSNTVVILHTVGPVIVESWIDHPNVTAVLYAGLPGQESGNSIVDVLFGGVNPSARLPYTISKAREDYPADILYTAPSDVVPQLSYSEELLLDYRWFDAKSIAPRFEFGFGLSYTSFDYTKLSIKPSGFHRRSKQVWENWNDESNAPGGPPGLWEDVVQVEFTVRNTGGVDGNEVSQVYLGFPEGAGEPPKVLRGFERTFLKKGAKTTVVVKLNRKALSIWDVVKQAWAVPKGDFKVFVGQSSRKIVLTGSFQQ
uniref:beta-glucosidase n=1 Tax=Glaciozyma antarctica TaxID=105987 RepID=I3UJK0_9BASI|nr:beta glucosidase [Glaciozyma antarctica]